MEQLTIAGVPYSVARAERRDVAEIVELLRHDTLGASREIDDLAPYEMTFEAIDRDVNHFLVVVKDEAGAVVATMKLTLLPCPAWLGGRQPDYRSRRSALPSLLEELASGRLCSNGPTTTAESAGPSWLS